MDKRIPVLDKFPWQLAVMAVVNTPSSSNLGDRFLVGTSPSGVFSGHANKIAWRDSSQWHFDPPAAGWRVYVNALGKYLHYNGSVWKEELVEGSFVKSRESSVEGKIPQWQGTGGDELKDGLTVRTTLRESPSADDASVVTEKAVRDAINSVLGANDAMVLKGGINCSTNPNYPAASAGHTYKVTHEGKIGGATGPNVEKGDMLVCYVDDTAAGSHATVGDKWFIVQVNIDGAVVFLGTSVTAGNLVEFLDATGRSIKDSGISVASIVAHLADTSQHFTQAQIDHNVIQNRGTNTHAQIDTHMAAAAKHREMTYVPELFAIIYTE